MLSPQKIAVTRTYGGGLFISEDNAESWVDENPVESTDPKGCINSIVVKDDKIFVGTASNGVFISTDDGINWKEKNNGLFNTRIITLKTVGNTIYAGTNSNLYISTNNGDNWTIKENVDNPAQIEAIASSDSIIALATSTNVLYISKDAGNSWYQEYPKQYISSLEIINNHLFIGTIGGFYEISDTEGKLEPKNIGLTNTLVNTIEYKGNRIYAGTLGNGIFLSTNNGYSWLPQNSGFSTNAYSSSWVYGLSIINDYLFAGTADDIYRKSDSAEVWVRKPRKSSLGNPTCFTQKGDSIFVGVYGKGVFLSSNYGNSWEPKSVGMKQGIINTIITNGNDLYAGTYGEGVVLSKDNGETWVQKNNGIPKNIYSLYAFDNKLYAGTNVGTIYLSHDNCETWKPIKPLHIGEIIYSIIVIDSNVFAGTNNGFYLSTNNGNNWQLTNDGLKNYDIRALKIKGDTLYAGTYGGGMHSAMLSDFGITSVEDNAINSDNYLYAYPPFPNPASKNIRSLVYWDTSSDIEQDEIGVYNIYGAKVSDRSKISFDKLNLYSGYLIWDCSGVETGVYMIVIKHGTETRTIKVVVN